MSSLVRWNFLVGCLALLLAASSQGADEHATFKRQEDVIYGRKFGMALTMDVFKPEHPNGLAMVSVISGDFGSSKNSIRPALYDVALQRGYTVFAVVQGSQPKFQIPEMMVDLLRAIRFIRANSARFGIDPAHIGISGMSSGGHLALMVATHGGAGNANAKDPVDRQSSAVQCVACFYPPTDFLNYGTNQLNVLALGIPAAVKPAFGNIPTNEMELRKFGRMLSPIYALTSNLPPTLILHGDADFRVPLQQSLSFRDKAVAMGDTVEVIVKQGQGHGWPLSDEDMEKCADWFDKYLRPKKAD